MGEIVEAANLPEYTKVYLKKDIFGWRVVHPITDPETKKLLWINILFGGWRNLFLLIIIFLILGLAVYSYQTDISNVIRYYEEHCLRIIQ